MPSTAIVEGIAVRKRQTAAVPRVYIALSFSIDELGGLLYQLANQINGGVDVDFSNFQLSLAPSGGGPQPATDALPHRFMAPEDGNECDFCGALEGHEIHRQRPETVRMVVDGVESDVEREPLSEAAQRLIDDAATDEPTGGGDVVTPEMQEAREALATRSRNGR